jgi:maleylpyruvate isomerase
MAQTLRDWLDGCIAAHRRLEELAQGVTDEMIGRPSLLPGWTVGHLLTHLARNADSHTHVITSAQRGLVEPQYADPATRVRGIEEGHARPARVQIEDVRRSNRELETAWAATGADIWESGMGLRFNGPCTIAEFVFLRWREVEAHVVDFGLRLTWDDLSAGYLDAEWEVTTARLAARVPDDVTLVVAPGDRPARAYGKGQHVTVVRASSRTTLAWLMGRGGEPGWPTLGSWP